MPTFPITIPVDVYKGTDERKRSQNLEQIRNAQMLEDFLNAKTQINGGGEYDYYRIADELGYSKELVRSLLQKAGGGSNGITLTQP